MIVRRGVALAADRHRHRPGRGAGDGAAGARAALRRHRHRSGHLRAGAAGAAARGGGGQPGAGAARGAGQPAGGAAIGVAVPPASRLRRRQSSPEQRLHGGDRAPVRLGLPRQIGDHVRVRRRDVDVLAGIGLQVVEQRRLVLGARARRGRRRRWSRSAPCSGPCARPAARCPSSRRAPGAGARGRS